MIDAYGHGVFVGGQSRYVRIDNEQFSRQTLNTGDFAIIIGEFKSLVNREIKLTPYIYVTQEQVIYSDGSRLGGMPWYSSALSTIYPPNKDQSTRYSRVEHNLPNPVVLGPGETINFEIKIYPLKAGVYHVHTYFVTDFGLQIGPGATITVTGETMPTAGEITQLYLPLASGVAALAVLTLVMLGRTRAQPTKEKAIRIYYVIKSSYETVWLSGAVFWLGAVLYLHLPANK